MGLRFRRSIKIAPGVRVNLNKKSASVTFGPKGLKHTVSTTGKSHTTVGVPGTGLSYTTVAAGRPACRQHSAPPHRKAKRSSCRCAFSSGCSVCTATMWGRLAPGSSGR